MGSKIDPPPPVEKITFKKPSLIRVKIRLQRVCNKLFKRTFITWYIKKAINRSVDA